MSAVAVRAALEGALNNMTPALATAWENVSYTPVAGTPYQKPVVMFAEPENPEMNEPGIYREQGIFQVTLFYPLQNGSKDAATRAGLLRTTFKRGASFVSAGVAVTINRTPAIAPGMPDGDRWAVPVKIRFYANVSPS